MRRPFAALLLSLLAACDGASPNAPEAEIPRTGRYVEQILPLSAVRVARDVIYSTRPNAGGQYTSGVTRDAEADDPVLQLRLDLAIPADASSANPQPLIVLVHGGGFVTGDKRDPEDWAVSYARAGYVVASINYRLTPNNQRSDSIRLQTIQHAVEDAQNAIRFLRSRAAVYGIDPTRVVTIGTSAGGGISLVNAVAADDARLRSDAPGVSSRVNGAIASGATLTGEGDEVEAWLTYDRSDSPVVIVHARETDGDTGKTWTGHVLPSQRRFLDAGIPCTVVAQPDGTHTVPLAVGGPYWDALRPFLWTTLQLDARQTQTASTSRKSSP